MFSNAFQTLHFAVRPRVVAKYGGQVLLAFAAATLVPATVALASGSTGVAWRYAVVIALFGLLGGTAARLRATEEIQANEALVVSALAFVIPGIVLAFPLTGYGIAPLDAVFESVSTVTTTGLSTVAGAADRPASFHFARSWGQWVGGLGVVVLALAFLLPAGTTAKRLGFEDEDSPALVGGTRSHARRLLVLYVLLTAGGWALCWLAGMGAFDALCHTFAGISTGGFSSGEASLGSWSLSARAAVSFVCILGSFSFFWMLGLSAGRLRRVLRDSQTWGLIVLVLLGGSILVASFRARGRFEGAEAFTQAAWMTISAQTTAGFSTLDTASLASVEKAVLALQMLVGGQVGSTAGGLKVLRLLLLLQLLAGRILRASMPERGELPQRLDGSRVLPDEVLAAATLAVTLLTVVALSWTAFLAYAHDPLDAFFDVASAVGTAGLSAGTVGPDLQPALKLVLIADMLLGRVEMFAILILLFPGTWIGRRRRSR